MLVCPSGNQTEGKVREWAVAATSPKKTTLHLTFGGIRSFEGWCLHGSPQTSPQLLGHVGAGLSHPYGFSSIVCELYTNVLSFHTKSVISFASSHFQLIPLFFEAAISEKHIKNPT